MAFGESYVQRQARLDRQRKAYPELEGSDYDTIGKVDALRRSEGRPLTTFGQAVEDTYIGIQQEQYNPDTPDTAPNVEGWTPQPLGLNELIATGRPRPVSLNTLPSTGASPNGDSGLTVHRSFEPLLTDLDRPRGAAVGFLSGENPADSLRRAGAGLADPSSQSGRNVGFVRNASDTDLWGKVPFAPDNVSPRDILGLGADLALDPVNYLPFGAVGKGRRAERAATRGAKAAGRAADTATDAVRPRGAPIGGNAASAPDRILTDLFGVELPDRGLTGVQRLENQARRLVGRSPLNEAGATPLFEDRSRWVRQAASVGNAERESLRAALPEAFQFDKKWQIKNLAGKVADWPEGPTLADLAAHRPQFDPFLTPQQRSLLADLERRLTPYEQAARAVNPELGVRADVEPGGFYLHRSYESPKVDRVRASTAGAGGKQSFERVADVASDSRAIRGGRQPVAPWEAIGDYVADVGKSAADGYSAQFSKEMFNPQTAAGRVPTKLRETWDKENARIIRARKTLDQQNVRLTAQAAEARRARDASGRAVGELANSSVARGAQRAAAAVTAEDVQLARGAVDDSITAARAMAREIGANAEKVRQAGRNLTGAEKKLLDDADALANLIAEAEGLGGGAARARDAAVREFGDALDATASGQSANVRQVRQSVEGALSLDKEYRKALDIADFAEEQMTSMSSRAARLAERVDQLTERGAVLGDLDRAERQALVEARRYERITGDLARKQAVADREIKLLERAAARASQTEQSATARATGQNLRTVRTQRILSSAVQRRDAMRGQWQDAVELSRRVPENRGQIDLAELRGTDFPLEVANAANRILRRETREPGVVEEVVLTLNNLYRGVTGTLDNSVFGNQLLLASAGRPKAVAKAAVVNFKAWKAGGDKALGQYINGFNRTAQTEALPDAARWARNGAFIGANDPEFVLGRGFAEKLKRAPGVRQANRAFGSAGTATRLEAMQAELRDEIQRSGKTWQALEESGKLREIAEGWNAGTGYSPRRVGGQAGDYALYAARYFQARIETLANASRGAIPARRLVNKVAPGVSAKAPLEARIARGAMVRLIGYATTMTVMGNAAQGYETDFRPVINGRWNSNFMRLRAGGRDWNLLGTYMSLARAITLTAMGKPQDAYRSLASGVVRDAWDLIAGEDAIGNETRSDPETFAKWLLSQHVPFSTGDVGEAAGQAVSGVRERDPGQVAGGLAGAAGAFEGYSQAPLSVKDRVQMGEFNNLKGEEQFKAIPAQAWRDAAGAFGEKADSYYDWREDAVAEVRNEFVKAGLSVGQAQQMAEQGVDRLPIAGTYSRVKNALETVWFAENPAEGRARFEAEMRKPGPERRNLPNKTEQRLIEAAR